MDAFAASARPDFADESAGSGGMQCPFRLPAVLLALHNNKWYMDR